MRDLTAVIVLSFACMPSAEGRGSLGVMPPDLAMAWSSLAEDSFPESKWGRSLYRGLRSDRQRQTEPAPEIWTGAIITSVQ